MKKSQVEQMINNNVLITTDCWFVAPNGREYKSVYGKLIGVFEDKSITGLKTNSKSTNWYLQVGTMILAGCQIHYAINCEGEDVNLGLAEEYNYFEGKCIKGSRPSKIYHSDINREF